MRASVLVVLAVMAVAAEAVVPVSTQSFSSVERFLPGSLDGQKGWNAQSGWSVDPSGSERLITTNSWQKAVHTRPVKMTSGESVVIRTVLKLQGIPKVPTNSTQILQFGVRNDTNAALNPDKFHNTVLRFTSTGGVELRGRNNTAPSTLLGTIATNGSANLAVEYTLNVGPAASNSTFGMKIMNLDTEVSATNSMALDGDIYTALTSGGVYPYLVSAGFDPDSTGVTGIEVDSTTVFSVKPDDSFFENLRTNRVASSSNMLWRQFGPGMSGNNFRLYCHPTDPDTLFLGPNMGNAYRSTDRGATYQGMLDADGRGYKFRERGPIELTSPDFSRQDPDFGFCSAQGSAFLYCTTNRGATWQVHAASTSVWNGISLNTIAVDPQNDLVWFAGSGTVSDPGEILFSADHPHGTNVAASHVARVWKTSDRGESWSTVTPAGLNTNAQIIRILVHPFRSNVVFAATTYGLYKSTDGGASWSSKTGAGLDHDIIRSFDMYCEPNTRSFAGSEGYVSGALDGQTRWLAQTGWNVDPAGSGKATVTSVWNKAVFDQAFTMSAGESRTFRTELKLLGSPVTPTNTTTLMQFGVRTDASTNNPTVFHNTVLSAFSTGNLILRGNNNGAPSATLGTIASNGTSRLAVEYTLNIGANPTSSTFAITITNMDTQASATGSQLLDSAIYTALTSGSGVYCYVTSAGFSQNGSGVTGIEVESVQVPGAVTLYALDLVKWAASGNTVSNDGGGVFRSTDEGESWQCINGDLGIDVSALVDDYQFRKRYFDAVNVWFTITNAQTLYTVYPTNLMHSFSTVRVNPADPDSIFLCNNYQWERSMRGGMLWKTDDGGAHWIAALRNGTAWGGIHSNYWEGRGNPVCQNIELRAQRKWLQKDSYADRTGPALEFNCDGSILYFQWAKVFCVSTNGGDTWVENDEVEATSGTQNWVGAGNSNLPGHGLRQDERLPGMLFLPSGENDFWITTPDGGSAQAARRIELGEDEYSCSDVALHPADTNIIYSLQFRQRYAGQLLCSTNGGGTFTNLGFAIQWPEGASSNDSIHQLCLTIDPADPDNMYFCIPAKPIVHGYTDNMSSAPKGVRKSTDGGTNWVWATNGLPASLDVPCIRLDPNDSTRIYACVYGAGGGLYMSTNRAASWVPFLTQPPGVSSVSDLHFSADGKMYLSCGTPSAAYTNGGVWMSDDGGQNWLQIFKTPWARMTKTSASDPSVILVQMNGFNLADILNPGTYLSRDGGASWSRINLGNPQSDRVNDIAVDQINSSVYYVSTYGCGWLRADEQTAGADSIADPLAAYRLWIREFPELGDRGDVQDDPDGDGLCNLLEYALGGNPQSPDAPEDLRPGFRSRNGAFEYISRRRKDAEQRGIRYQFEMTDSLISGGWVPFTPDSSSGEINDTFSIVTNTIPAADSSRFIRLKIMLE